MGKKIIIAFIITVILLTGIWYVFRKYSEYEYNRETVVIGPETEQIAIYIKPDDSATRAAANYLTLAIERTLGKQTDVVTEQDKGFHGIRILCGTEIPESEQKASIIFITTAEAANANMDPVYSIYQDENGISLLIPDRENCFGTVKAVTDRWLQKDCGLESAEELRVSQAMIDQQLSRLSTAVTEELRILTQNLCYSDDGESRTVIERAMRFFRQVEEYQPDLIGTQECSWQWLQLLQSVLGDRYEIYGDSRRGTNFPEEERDVILFRKDRFKMIDCETFWLSNTPGEPATKLNYSGPCRICTWALLLDTETGKSLLFSNTHLQNGSFAKVGEVRDKQAEILLWRLRKGNNLAKYPGFLIGDFNGSLDEPFYSRITECYEDSKSTAITNSSTVDYSYHAYGTRQMLLDFCFHSPKNVTVLDYHILDDQYDGYVSDHYGILITAVVN